MKKCILVAMLMVAGIAVLGGGSISFTKAKYKLGRPAFGNWSVQNGWTAVGIRTSDHLGGGLIKPKLPVDGQRSGRFSFTTVKYTKVSEKAQVWLILKDSSGVAEDESAQPTDTCIIVGIEGLLSGTGLSGNFRRAVISIKAIAHPSNLGNITNSKLNIVGRTTPKTPYSWSTSANTSIDSEIFFHLDRTFVGENVKISSTLDFGGFNFKAIGFFTGDGGGFGAPFN